MNAHQNTAHDNDILFDFNILFDSDIAIYRIIKSDYNDIPYVYKELIDLDNEEAIILLLLLRRDPNPLTLFMPNVDTTKLYEEMLINDKKHLLSKIKPTDLLQFCFSILHNANSVGVAVRCNDQDEADVLLDFCKKFNIDINYVIKKRSDIDLKEYTTLYTKYLIDLKDYKNLKGKNIYIVNANYNIDNSEINILLSGAFSMLNVIKTIDMYDNVKFISYDALKKILEGENKT